MTRVAWDPVAYAKHGAFVPGLGGAVLDLLAAQPGERILDLGCGDGVLTQRLVEAGATVVGVDADPAMVAAAIDKGLDAHVGDGRTLAFDGAFDAVFTNAALHWMGQPERVSAGVFRALKPGGRYVGEFGGFGNLAAVRVAVRAVLTARGYRPPDDNYYPTAAAFADVLTAAGFVVSRAEITARPTPLSSGIGAWLQTFRDTFVADAGVPADKRAQIFEDVRALLRPVLADDAGNWSADYVRLRFAATKP
jgi:SAM-dependent methyltransferase